jgi:hypothetical protein
MWRGKALSVPFLCVLKLEVKFFQCVGGKTKCTYAFKNCAQGKSQGPHHTGRGKALSVPFLWTLKLEVKFFQCVAVRANQVHLRFLSCARSKE